MQNRPPSPSHAWAAGPHDRAERRGWRRETDEAFSPSSSSSSSAAAAGVVNKVSSSRKTNRAHLQCLQLKTRCVLVCLLQVGRAEVVNRCELVWKRRCRKSFSLRKTRRNQWGLLKMRNVAHLARCSHQGDTEEPFKPAHTQLSPLLSLMSWIYLHYISWLNFPIGLCVSLITATAVCDDKPTPVKFVWGI